MISNKLIDFMKKKNWWFDEISDAYVSSLELLGIPLDSDAAFFFLHAEDGPSFCSKKGQIHQIGWHIANTNYIENTSSQKKTLGIPDNYLALDNFENGSGFFYDSKTGWVIYLETGSILINFQHGSIEKKWESFNDFIEWFFDIK
ncbi:hypothetical protein [Iodobacter fluviatilis]|uniref:SMI1/KNR4 family protein n=1 Tax=Iodobacter fluviatilis TaxID=537 RepID=A0A377Q590_9NEIS|nr:hypothetical protein [Iodobacter fluviatilis]TCU82634.1 hypothetical protein EV682_1146 [Iodobacter fluviatilis]STQ89880.1 Uncharacterised protein [Iodobacter fluviatilis]